MENWTGQYAYGHSKTVESMTPLQLKHLIHPVFLIGVFPKKDVAGFYILDKLQFKKISKK